MPPRFKIAQGYRLEAESRARSGKPVSETLLAARRVIRERGWAPPGAERRRLASRGPVDVLMAIRNALGGSRRAPLDLADYYVLLAPIASVVGTSFARWERRPGLDTDSVLAMLSEAIAYALEAEDGSRESFGVKPPASERLH